MHRKVCKKLLGLMMSKILVSTPFRVCLSHPNYCPDQPKGEDYIDENGIRTTVEYTVNDEGKKIKVCHGSIPVNCNVSQAGIDNKKNSANSSKIPRRACCGRAKNMGQVWTRKRQ